MVANLIDEVRRFDGFGADIVNGREQREFVRQIFVLQHNIDLLGSRRSLQLLTAQQLVFQFFDGLKK